MNLEENLLEESELFEHFRFVVDKGQSPVRIDKFLTLRIENATRTKVQKGIELGNVLVNEKPIKSNYLVKPSDLVTVVLPTPPRNTELIPENIPIDTFYEDNDLIVINKKAGMVVHPGFNNYSGTLVNALLYQFSQLPEFSDEMRPGLVHRIDKDTSGLIVVAKNEDTLIHLAKQFFDHSIQRIYHAIVWGDVKNDEGTIDTFLARDKKDRRLSAVYHSEEEGKRAITHYKVIERYGFCTYIQCQLETGRTHQIRAHLKHLSHPLFADEMYGGKNIPNYHHLTKFNTFINNSFEIMNRQALHAKTLGFIHPKTKEKIFLESALAKDFELILERFRGV